MANVFRPEEGRQENSTELQDREFLAAIQEGCELNCGVGKVFGCYRVLHQLRQQLNVG